MSVEIQQEECPICMIACDVLVVCPNNHKICSDCFDSLINHAVMGNLNCPMCRKLIISEGLDFVNSHTNEDWIVINDAYLQIEKYTIQSLTKDSVRFMPEIILQLETNLATAKAIRDLFSPGFVPVSVVAGLMQKIVIRRCLYDSPNFFKNIVKQFMDQAPKGHLIRKRSNAMVEAMKQCQKTCFDVFPYRVLNLVE